MKYFRRNRILVVYDINSIHVKTISEYLDSFKKYSDNTIMYASGTGKYEGHIDEGEYDAVIVHYSARISFGGVSQNCLSKSWIDALSSFNGLKILIAQDEFDLTENSRLVMETIGFHKVYSIIPADSLHTVYPPSRFQNTEFESVFAGYIPESLAVQGKSLDNLNRKIVIGYRGRNLPFWYGKLGQEKKNIGKIAKELCIQKNIPSDIEWADENRIYGDDWYSFITQCRSMLGTEGGSNILDEYGAIKSLVLQIQSIDPAISFDSVYEKYLKYFENKIRTNQLTPKLFEAISLKTALILFEGHYSGILTPWVHYFPLKKDFSNFDEIINAVSDDERVSEVTSKAYHDIVLSQKYSYKSFISKIDSDIKNLIQSLRTTRSPVATDTNSNIKNSESPYKSFATMEP